MRTCSREGEEKKWAYIRTGNCNYGSLEEDTIITPAHRLYQKILFKIDIFIFCRVSRELAYLLLRTTCAIHVKGTNV
jgi:hypothetical protein